MVYEKRKTSKSCVNQRVEPCRALQKADRSANPSQIRNRRLSATMISLQERRIDLPLAGLILTEAEDGSDPDRLAALQAVAGQTLFEYQARIARACGVGHLVVLVDRMPAELVAALDRLRGDGVDVEVARSMADAADRFHPEEMVVVIAGGVVATRAVIERLTQHQAPLVLAVPEDPANSEFERIDATHRWSGLALLTGAVLRKTAGLIGDWTAGPTLLRVALQEGVRREQTEGVFLVRSPADAQSASLRLLSEGAEPAGIALDQLLIDPLVTRALPGIMSSRLQFDIIALMPWVLLLISLGTAAAGWVVAAFTFFVLSAIPTVAARRMAHVSARRSAALEMFERLRLPAFSALAIILGWNEYAQGRGWGSLVLAAWAIIALILQPPVPRARWMADAGWAALLLLAATAAGQPLAGLVALVAYSVVTQFVLVRSIR
jgi:hypothetical protein